MLKILLAGLPNTIPTEGIFPQATVVQIETIPELLELLKRPWDLLLLPNTLYKTHYGKIAPFLGQKSTGLVFLLQTTLSQGVPKDEDKLLRSIFPLKAKAFDKELLQWVQEFHLELQQGLRYKTFEMDYGKRQVMVDGSPLVLTPLEFDLLHFLRLHTKTTLSRDELIKAVWGYSFLGDSRTIDTHIKSLRKKLGPYRCLIKTVWGKGYHFELCP